MSSDYHFVTEWRVAGSVAEVKEIFSDAESLTRWWPAVYLGARVSRPGASDGVGRLVDVYTTGWLPYTLRWTMNVTEAMTDEGFALEATGDFVGAGRWSLATDGPEVVATYDWRVRATKPLLSRLSWILKPAFAANHHWAMRRGEDSLRLELRRRRSVNDDERRRVPPPPPATFRWLVSWADGWPNIPRWVDQLR